MGDSAHYSPRFREAFLKMADWIFETVSSRAGLIASLGVLSLSTNCTGVQFPGRLRESHLFPEFLTLRLVRNRLNLLLII